MLKKHKYRTMVSHLSCVSLYHRTSVPIINKFLLAHIWLRIRNLIGLVLVYAIMSGFIYVLILLFQSMGYGTLGLRFGIFLLLIWIKTYFLLIMQKVHIYLLDDVYDSMFGSGLWWQCFSILKYELAVSSFLLTYWGISIRICLIFIWVLWSLSWIKFA